MISPVFLLAGIGAVSRSLLWRRLDFRRVSLIEMVALARDRRRGRGRPRARQRPRRPGDRPRGPRRLADHHGAAADLGCHPPAALAPRRAGRNPRLRPARLRRRSHLVAITNATLAVAAVRLTATQVGLFWRAFQLGVIYQEKISGIMVRLAFPVYSRTNDLDELRGFHERATRIHAAVLLPLLALLAVTAPDLVPWLFGERWAPAVEPVQILCAAGMIAASSPATRRSCSPPASRGRCSSSTSFLLTLYVADLLVRRALRDHRPRRGGRRRPRLPPLRRLRRPLPAGARDPRPPPRHRPAAGRREQRAAARRRLPRRPSCCATLDAPVFRCFWPPSAGRRARLHGRARTLFPVVWADVAQLTRAGPAGTKPRARPPCGRAERRARRRRNLAMTANSDRFSDFFSPIAGRIRACHFHAPFRRLQAVESPRGAALACSLLAFLRSPASAPSCPGRRRLPEPRTRC